jgi:hypothetical protein
MSVAQMAYRTQEYVCRASSVDLCRRRTISLSTMNFVEPSALFVGRYATGNVQEQCETRSRPIFDVDTTNVQQNEQTDKTM